ncbi:MAG: bifunctional 4-hydroxy-2-oxoglutarate aldolase/2-dehydro-3-deoxy-phosphogluconate aldolase [Desulfarculaceae bacterium]|jgi:2-dehydro-3-deoxyphosphogluconate aldolase/(4S)-4-hydroxy-2-oxoglutarate aldolase
MARFSRLEVLNAMLELGLVPVFYNPDLDKAKGIIDACLEGGARVLEFTNRGDLAYRVFCDLLDYTAQKRPQVILGVGSVIDAPTAALYINSGANFVVGPCLNPEAARLCNRRKVAYSPGCGSVSEISQAEELGAEIVKIFPGGQVGGPDFVKAVKGPLPWTRLMPTGGVAPTQESVSAWIGAGAACLGMGSKLVSKELVANSDWAGISRNVAQCLEFIEKARAS